MYNYYDGQNQNMSPYNNYGRMNYNPLNNGMNMKNLPHYEVIRVNGRVGAEVFQMGENSSVLLLDETANIIWFAQTDGAGYKTLTPRRCIDRYHSPTLQERRCSPASTIYGNYISVYNSCASRK